MNTKTSDKHGICNSSKRLYATPIYCFSIFYVLETDLLVSQYLPVWSFHVLHIHAPASVHVLWFPPTVERRACHFIWMCGYESVWLFAI